MEHKEEEEQKKEEEEKIKIRNSVLSRARKL